LPVLHIKINQINNLFSRLRLEKAADAAGCEAAGLFENLGEVIGIAKAVHSAASACPMRGFRSGSKTASTPCFR
jgi:hypothetical protein